MIYDNCPGHVSSSPPSVFRMAGNFFKVKYAGDLSPQTMTQVHSSPSSHLSKDEYNPLASFLFTYKPEHAYGRGPGMQPALNRIGRGSFTVMYAYRSVSSCAKYGTLKPRKC